MQDVQDTAAVADDENTTAEADSPSSVSDVKSPGERHVAVEVSNAILDRVQVLPRPPSVRSTNALLTPAAVCPGQANALHPLMVIGGLAPSEREALLGGDTLHGERVFIAYM